MYQLASRQVWIAVMPSSYGQAYRSFHESEALAECSCSISSRSQSSTLFISYVQQQQQQQQLSLFSRLCEV